MKIANIIRTVLSILLIILVWMHSHWSVAITITLLVANDIMICHALKEERMHRIARQRAENKMFRRMKKIRNRLDKIK